ncbi:hypothetical protein RBSH_05561 [Rhodopirellula baltica SH28]|uniref:Uncharacterized protein n=2 Tax=Rhodopirellula baltica TaxID=265606 RepID=K5C823_RHOBT|nr:hypothetical protein RBSH_05561 [Rhodopirellula baltica SH28]ELP32151.1 hypothetical protein RBSWK_03850 [Rhodopirellula baltica SWK14]
MFDSKSKPSETAATVRRPVWTHQDFSGGGYFGTIPKSTDRCGVFIAGVLTADVDLRCIGLKRSTNEDDALFSTEQSRCSIQSWRSQKIPHQPENWDR